MKHLLKITLGLFICMGIMASCNKDDDNNITGFSLDKEDITIGAEGGTDNVLVTSADEWVATASEPWVTISPANGIGSSECRIAIDSTLVNDMRSAQIRFATKGKAAQTITVHQTGYDKMIYLEKKELEFNASAKNEERFFEIVVTTNVAFGLQVEYTEGDHEREWLTPETFNIELDRGARPRTAKIKVKWLVNTEAEQRVAKLKFVPSNEGDELKEPVVMTITQKAAPKIEDNRAGDSLALLTMNERLQAGSLWDASENMRNWEKVTLWEKTDKDLPSEMAIGRVRSVEFIMMSTKESIPQEVRFLKYLETLAFYSNVNTMFLSIDLENHVCSLEHLKHLQIGAYGLVSLPNDFVKLGKKLETLDLSSNNFTDVPAILTKENFPKLKSLSFVNNRRFTTSDLRKANEFENGIGFHLNMEVSNTIKRLLLWDTLESLALSYNYIEGKIPDFEVGVDGVQAYTQADVDAFGGDTIQWLANNRIPKILPKMKRLAINLNFITGTLPNWLLYHPRLIDWHPEVMVFTPMENAIDSNGKVVRYENAPKNFDYYYNAFPLFKAKYEFPEEEK